jgi:hypothetical protein
LDYLFIGWVAKIIGVYASIHNLNIPVSGQLPMSRTGEPAYTERAAYIVLTSQIMIVPTDAYNKAAAVHFTLHSAPSLVRTASFRYVIVTTQQQMADMSIPTRFIAIVSVSID